MKNDNSIWVWIKRPGKMARHILVTNTLEVLQEWVDGYLETVTISRDCVVICDEEGRLKGKEYNCTIEGVDFVGDIILAGVKGSEFADTKLNALDIALMIKED
jgi:hypothetical protein